MTTSCDQTLPVNAVRDYIDQNPQNWLFDPDNPATAA